MARVFVSYSRKNKGFCKRLTDELQKHTVDFWVDWEGIPPTVDWMKEIEKGIEEADAFMAIVSPDWISSKVCQDELNIAVKNGKRLIPVTPCEIDWNNLPPVLAQLNFIFFTEDFDFNQQVDTLFNTLHTDYEWLKTQRRLQVKALEWERGSKDNSFLLRGKDLEEAEQQISVNATKEPFPTDIQREYVLKSRQATDRQRKIVTTVSIAAALVMFVITAVVVTPLILNRIAQSRARGEMIPIPAGETIFGTKNETYIDYGFVPQQRIHYDAFEIEKYEVTNYQYGLCVQYSRGVCSAPADQKAFRDKSKKNYPVVDVNIYQANAYCRWLGQRLPTDVEWERAARGPNGDEWPWGNEPPTDKLVNMQSLITKEATSGTQPVDSHPLGASKPEGIYNLIGNVWEWTSSYAYVKGTSYDPTQFWDGQPETFDGSKDFVQRGGGWQVNIEDVALFNPATGLKVRDEMGFRCAANPK